MRGARGGRPHDLLECAAHAATVPIFERVVEKEGWRCGGGKLALTTTTRTSTRRTAPQSMLRRSVSGRRGASRHRQQALCHATSHVTHATGRAARPRPPSVWRRGAGVRACAACVFASVVPLPRASRPRVDARGPGRHGAARALRHRGQTDGPSAACRGAVPGVATPLTTASPLTRAPRRRSARSGPFGRSTTTAQLMTAARRVGASRGDTARDRGGGRRPAATAEGLIEK